MIGFSYNGIHSRTYDIIAKTVSRPILPILRKRELIIPGRHGTYDFNDNTFEKRFIEIELRYVGTSFDELRTRARTIASWLNGYDGSKNLIFDDESNKWYTGKIYSEIGLSNLFRLGEATVTFECEPFAYISGTASFTWASSPHTFEQNNNGTIKTPLDITIVGVVENPQIIQDGTTATFTISANMTAGGTMIIDSDAMVVTYEGANYLDKMTGTFVDLEVGANKLFFHGTNPSAEVTFSWNYRFL